MQCFRVGYRGICHASRVFSVYTLAFRKFSENLGKSSEVQLGKWGYFRKISETVQKCFPDVFIIFWNFRKIFGNLRNCSEIIGNFSDEIGNVCTGSQELKSFGVGFWEIFKKDLCTLLRASNDGKVEWNTTSCILPVAYRRICNGNPGLWLAVLFKAWDKNNYFKEYFTWLSG